MQPDSWDIDTGRDHLLSADPVLARIVERCGTVEPWRSGDAYPSLFRSILYQQLAGAAAAAIERRVLALFDGDGVTPEAFLATPDDALRAAGLSRQKLGYLRDLSEKAVAGVIGDDLRHLPDQDVIARVTSVKGIGRWTADIFLMGCLRRPDVLPVGDLGIRKAFHRAYELSDLPLPPEMERIAEPWRPYRTLASRYLWQWLDTTVPDGTVPD